MLFSIKIYMECMMLSTFIPSTTINSKISSSGSIVIMDIVNSLGYIVGRAQVTNFALGYFGSLLPLFVVVGILEMNNFCVSNVLDISQSDNFLSISIGVNVNSDCSILIWCQDFSCIVISVKDSMSLKIFWPMDCWPLLVCCLKLKLTGSNSRIEHRLGLLCQQSYNKNSRCEY